MVSSIPVNHNLPKLCIESKPGPPAKNTKAIVGLLSVVKIAV